MSPLWECPNCGARFVTRNVWHSCGRHSLRALFARCEPGALALYERFVAMVEACGPVTIIPHKRRISFQVRVRFAAVLPLRNAIDVSFWFTTPHQHPRVRRIERYTPHAYRHVIRLASEGDFDAQLAQWLREAYAIGEQRHLFDT